MFHFFWLFKLILIITKNTTVSTRTDSAVGIGALWSGQLTPQELHYMRNEICFHKPIRLIEFTRIALSCCGCVYNHKMVRVECHINAESILLLGLIGVYGCVCVCVYVFAVGCEEALRC